MFFLLFQFLFMKTITGQQFWSCFLSSSSSFSFPFWSSFFVLFFLVDVYVMDLGASFYFFFLFESFRTFFLQYFPNWEFIFVSNFHLVRFGCRLVQRRSVYASSVYHVAKLVAEDLSKDELINFSMSQRFFLFFSYWYFYSPCYETSDTHTYSNKSLGFRFIRSATRTNRI